MMMKYLRILCILGLGLAPAAASAAVAGAAAPGAEDRCRVCGMFVAPHSEFLAQMVFSDGTRAFFDGNRDLFQYYFRLKREQPAEFKRITALFVTDYYDVEPVDGYGALFVIGSDVVGPMGPELIAFATEPAAEEFKRDHRGRSILTFDQVSEETLGSLR